MGKLEKYTSYKDSDVEWLGEIPEHWETQKMKYLGKMFAGLTDKNGNDFSKEFSEDKKPFIPFTNVCNNVKIDNNQMQYVKVKPYERQNKVQKNDIIFLMSSETLDDIGKCSIHLDEEQFYLNSFCKGFRPKKSSINPEFLNYLLQSKTYRNYFALVGRGFTRINIKQEYINDLFTVLPKDNEQTKIASFLDEKTSQIDNAISQKEKLIELLKEQKQITIIETVRKGLNKNVEFKDSGIKWIGKIPKNWNITIAKHVLRKLERPRKQNGDTVICSNHGYSKLLGDIKQGLVSLTQHDYQGVNEGDLLVHGMDAWHGAISISKHTGDCTSVVHVCDSKHNKIYIAYFLKMLAIMNVYKVISNGVRQNTSDFRSWQKFGDIQLLLPPKEEQNQIAEYIENQTTKIDKAIELQQNYIAKLKEYKASLIDSVVTGKVRVA